MSAKSISDWFWNERIWLPPNVTWEKLGELADRTPNNYSNFSYLWYPIPAALVVIALRSVFEKYVFRPLGIAMGLRSAPHRKPAPNPALEAAFNRHNAKLGEKTALELASSLHMTERQVERWWRMKKGLNRPTTLEKFCETG